MTRYADLTTDQLFEIRDRCANACAWVMVKPTAERQAPTAKGGVPPEQQGLLSAVIVTVVERELLLRGAIDKLTIDG